MCLVYHWLFFTLPIAVTRIRPSTQPLIRAMGWERRIVLLWKEKSKLQGALDSRAIENEWEESGVSIVSIDCTIVKN